MKEQESEVDKEYDKKQQIMSLLESAFRSHGYSTLDNFDHHIWFLDSDVQGKNAEEYFHQLVTETPKEDDDIIKFMLFNSFKKSLGGSNKNIVAFHYTVPVKGFIEEVAFQIMQLFKQNRHLDDLIQQYNAYETVNTIKQNTLNFHKYEERTTEITKSVFSSSLSSMKGIPKGDYQFSLLITQVGEDDITKSKQLEYVLKHIIHIGDESNKKIEFRKNNIKSKEERKQRYHVKYHCNTQVLDMKI